MNEGTISVTFTDGTTTTCLLKPLLADLVAVERHFGISAAALNTPDARTEWTLFLIWRILGRSGETRQFEEWLESVETIDALEGAQAPDPTNLEAQPA
jgi:hypothetical protein